jgi:SRSO17 transposase
MDRQNLKRLDSELRSFLDEMFGGMGRRERGEAMRAYVSGLLLDGERKSVVPMASRLVDDEAEVQAMRQRLQECIAVSDWSEATVWARLAKQASDTFPGIEAFVIDDTGFPKKGDHSVGVQRQYSGTLGRVDNCQVAVSTHLAGEQGSVCVGMNLYLPESWANDPTRRKKAGIPREVAFEEKWRTALRQVDAALEAGVPKHVVLADAGYGDVGEFRQGLADRGLQFVVGVTSTAVVWPPEANLSLPPRSKSGRPPTRLRDDEYPPISLAKLAERLRFRKVSWREGTRGMQSSRFAAVRVHTAHKHKAGAPPGPCVWYLCEWPSGETAPQRSWLSSLPENTSLKTLVRLAKLRWRVERDYQDMKGEVGLDHFEGRTWRGFHHHVTLVAVAHAFLALRRALFPPDQMDAA